MPQMSADGHYLVLEDDSPTSAPTSPPTGRMASLELQPDEQNLPPMEEPESEA